MQTIDLRAVRHAAIPVRPRLINMRLVNAIVVGIVLSLAALPANAQRRSRGGPQIGKNLRQTFYEAGHMVYQNRPDRENPQRRRSHQDIDSGAVADRFELDCSDASSNSRARWKTARIISAVSFPVNVFCWLG